MDKSIQEEFKKELGFTPPGIMVSDHFWAAFKRRLADYHHDVWSEEGAIPLKYRYFIALATAIFDDNEKRARLELTKAMNHGATREELLEVFKQQVWMKGAPTLVQIAPLIEMMDKKFSMKKEDL